MVTDLHGMQNHTVNAAKILEAHKVSQNDKDMFSCVLIVLQCTPLSVIDYMD